MIFSLSFLFVIQPLFQLQRQVIMALNLDKLVSSEVNYQKYIKETLETIRKDKDMESTLKKIILFCKYAFTVNFVQKKKFLCLSLIKDISQNIKSQYFEKILDQNIPVKLLKTITYQINNQTKESKNQQDQPQYSEKMLRFAIETINFWTKKLSFLSGKSQFAEVYEQLKKLKVQIPKNYEYYHFQKLSLGLWGQREQNSQQYVKNEEMSPLISELFDKFTECKALIEQRINESVLNEEQIYLKSIIQKLRDFLLAFFSKYKNLEVQTSLDRDVLIVYFHIANILFKRISSRFYIPVKEMIDLTKEVFEGDHSTEFSSVDRMDIINLAGIHKYNALSIFQRIHSRIELQETKLGPCELTFEQKDVLVYANQKGTGKQHQKQEQRRAPKFKR